MPKQSVEKRRTVSTKKPASLGEWKPTLSTSSRKPAPVRLMGDVPQVAIVDTQVFGDKAITGAASTPVPEPDRSPHMLGLALIALAIFAFGLVIGLAVAKVAA